MNDQVPTSPELKRIMRIAAVEAERVQAPAVGVEHLLVAMHQEGANVGAAMMQQFGLTLQQVRELDFTKKET